MTSPRPKAPAVVVSAVRPRDGSLVPSERDVVTGRPTDLDRDDKNRRRDDHDDEHGVEPAPATGPAPVPRPRFPRWAVVAAGAAVVVVVAGGVAVASGALGGGASPSSDAPSAEAPSAVDAASAPSTSEEDSGEVLDLAGVDACSLLSLGDVQALTSEPSEFITDSGPSSPNEAGCFWAVPKAGFPAYVDLSASRSDGTFSPIVVNDVECTATPVDMGGVPAEGSSCPGTVFLRAFDRGVMVSLQVNEPNVSISPADLVQAVRSVFDQL